MVPKSIFFSKQTSLKWVLMELDKGGISFPMILKPNEGERGKGVVKITNEKELGVQLEKINADYIIQEFIDLPHEYGILFYKFPNKTGEGISSIGFKELPFIEGDGVSTIKKLLVAKFKHRHFENTRNINVNTILEKGQRYTLEYVAHRSRNCIFKNYNHIHCPELVRTFSKIAQQIDGFYLGRFDVKANGIDDLIHGKDIKILEVNGVNSMPIHIFDPDYSFTKTYSDLRDHWKLIYTISKQNQEKEILPTSSKKLFQEIKLHNRS